MPDAFTLQGEWAGSPARLQDDTWGAWVPYTDTPPGVGDKVVITSKAGRSFSEWITLVEKTGVKPMAGDNKLALCRTSSQQPPTTHAEAAQAAMRRDDAVPHVDPDTQVCPACGQPLPPPHPAELERDSEREQARQDDDGGPSMDDITF